MCAIVAGKPRRPSVSRGGHQIGRAPRSRRPCPGRCGTATFQRVPAGVQVGELDRAVLVLAPPDRAAAGCWARRCRSDVHRTVRAAGARAACPGRPPPFTGVQPLPAGAMLVNSSVPSGRVRFQTAAAAGSRPQQPAAAATQRAPELGRSNHRAVIVARPAAAPSRGVHRAARRRIGAASGFARGRGSDSRRTRTFPR